MVIFMEQFIISISREFGSLGHEIAEQIARHYNLTLYDRNILNEVANSRNVDVAPLHEYDEERISRIFHRTIRGMSTHISDHVAQLQFDFVKEKAKSGESFVVVGRCSESILKEYKGLISIFIRGDRESKIHQVMEAHHLTRSESIYMIRKKDWRRKEYHNTHCDYRWGDSRNYDLTINSSKLCLDECVKLLIDYIDKRYKKIYEDIRNKME